MRNFSKKAKIGLLIATIPVSACPSAAAEVEPTSTVQVTATRIPGSAETVPANITVIRGEELRARGARDLASALSLVAGVDAPSGGDTGPSGAVPSFWGLHEFDAFLLVVDGVPWGGAFNPAIPTLNLNNVERIEVLKGAAPVIYGATSFVGVIQVVHYAAGQASNEAQVGFGDRGSLRVSAATALTPIGAFRHSLAVDGEKLGFVDAREVVKSGNLLYRGAGAVGDGTLNVDLNLAWRRQVPPSPVVRTGTALTSLTPLNANFNPADAKIDENRYQLGLAYSRATAMGQWDATLSWTHANVRDVRGFLRSDLVNDGSDNADSQQQRRNLHDLYADLHLTQTSGNLKLLLGLDFLYGTGRQSSANGAYYVPLSGAALPPKTTDLHVDEINTINDTRTFAGQYVQVQWKPEARWEMVAGLRLNETREKKTSTHVDGFDPTENESADAKKSIVRLGGTVGTSYRAWQSGADTAVVYANYRDTFKPAAIDFGPDFTPSVLKPETAQSIDAGIKGALMGGKLNYNVSLFFLKFKNLVLRTTDVDGGPVLQNAGGENLRGMEIQTRYRLANDLSMAANISYHDARFTQGMATEGGANLDLAGKHLTLSPRVLASSGLIYSSPTGFNATATLGYVGRRCLDLANQAPIGGYTKIDGSLGYRHGLANVTLNLYNLSNKRPPVTPSEFGDASYYLLQGRRIFLNVGYSL